MNGKIQTEELKQIPFLNPSAWGPDRVIPGLSFYVMNEWHCWLPTPMGLKKIQMWPVESNYFGDKPERPTDQCFLFFHFLAQRSLSPDMLRTHEGIWNDFQNLATSLAKLEVFFELSKEKHNVRRFVETEVEYIVMVCRGVYDLLQEMISAHWQRVTLFDELIKKRQLPKSFADVVLHADTPRTSEEIATKYKLPESLARWYSEQCPFFSWLRNLRNKTVHGGNASVEQVFATERGFAINRKERDWCDLYVWPKGCELPNELVPLRPAVCMMVKNVISTCESFSDMFQKVIQFPDELFPGLAFFTRGYYDKQLCRLDAIVQGALWDDAPIVENVPVNA